MKRVEKYTGKEALLILANLVEGLANGDGFSKEDLDRITIERTIHQHEITDIVVYKVTK